MKTNIALPLLIVLIIVAFFTQARAMLSAEEEIIITDLYNERDTKNLSDLSINLILAAQTNHHEHYNQIKSEMSALLETDEYTSTQAWMMGRMVAAAQFMNDEISLKKYSAILEKQAPKEKANDPMGVWANGYLLEYYAYHDRDKYEDNKEVFLNKADELIKKLDLKDKDRLTIIAWVHVVNLHAVAAANDLGNYIAIKNKLVADTKPSASYMQPWGIVQALSVVPRTDYPAWIHYWALRALEAMHDQLLIAQVKPAAEVILGSQQQNIASGKSIEQDFALGAVNREWIKKEKEANPNTNFLNFPLSKL